jgi:DNA polymerase-3 subunit epsilon
LLAEVYLAMTRGQDALAMDLAPAMDLQVAGPIDASRLIVLAASEEEIAAHEAVLDRLQKHAGATPVWRRALPA